MVDFILESAQVIGIGFLILMALYIGSRLMWAAFFRSLRDFLNQEKEPRDGTQKEKRKKPR